MNRPMAFGACAAGIGALCLMDALLKLLSLDHGVLQVTFWRYGTGTLVAALIWAAAGRPRPGVGGLRLHLLRGTLIAAMAVSFVWALTLLPLALVICITFIAPLMMPPLAALFLNEPMQRRYVLAGFMGFVGVLVAVGNVPDLTGDRLLAVAAALFAAVCYGGSAIVMRARAAADGA
ncbi:EamA family transporter, partial [Sandarakinorhabdus sp.]|uniref:EamA family transporter n=1 Tax=Sandarakinorhabdus sp. TaxID=1916663 RepID=UPI00286DCDB2